MMQELSKKIYTNVVLFTYLTCDINLNIGKETLFFFTSKADKNTRKIEAPEMTYTEWYQNDICV